VEADGLLQTVIVRRNQDDPKQDAEFFFDHVFGPGGWQQGPLHLSD
jgi:hypothetical protein